MQKLGDNNLVILLWWKCIINNEDKLFEINDYESKFYNVEMINRVLGVVVQLGMMPASGAGGRWFESGRPHKTSIELTIKHKCWTNQTHIIPEQQ